MHILDKDLPSILLAKLNGTRILNDDKPTQVGGKQVIVTYDGYIIPLVSREGLMDLEFIGKPTIDDLTKYPSV